MTQHRMYFMGRHGFVAVVMLFLSSVVCAPKHLCAQEIATNGEHPVAETRDQWKPHIIEDELPNGLRILYTRVNDIPLAEISVLTDAGTTHEYDDRIGVAYATGQLLIKGSQNRSAGNISARLDDLGSVIVPYVHYDYAQLYAKTLSKHFGSTIELLADVLMRPAFTQQEWDLFQKKAARALLRPLSSVGEQASRMAIGSLCSMNSAYTRPLQPASSELEALTLEDVKIFHSRHYQPNSTTIIVSGDLDYAFVRTLIADAFGTWTATDEAYDNVPAPAPLLPVRYLIDSRTADSMIVHVRMCIPSVARDSEDFPALLVLNALLTEGKDARLRKALWNDQVISPTFTSTLGIARNCNYCMIAGTVSPALTEQSLSAVTNALADLQTKPVTAEELSRAKQYLLADVPLMFASNGSMLGQMKELAIYRMPPRVLTGYADQIENVTSEDLQRVAHTVFDPANISVAVAGNAGLLLPQLRDEGKGWKVIAD